MRMHSSYITRSRHAYLCVFLRYTTVPIAIAHSLKLILNKMRLPVAPSTAQIVENRPGLIQGDGHGSFLFLMGNTAVSTSEFLRMVKTMFGDFLSEEKLAPFSRTGRELLRGVAVLLHEKRENTADLRSPEEVAEKAARIQMGRAFIVVSFEQIP